MSIVPRFPHPWRSHQPYDLDDRVREYGTKKLSKREQEKYESMLRHSTLKYITRQNLIGAADAVARRLGLPAEDGKRKKLETYTYTSYFGRPEIKEELENETPEDIRGKFWIERFKWDGGFMVIVKDAGHRKFEAVPVDPTKKCTGPIVIHDGLRYEITYYEGGSWVPKLLKEYQKIPKS